MHLDIPRNVRIADAPELPGKTKPREVFKNHSLKFRFASHRVDILDATRRAREIEIQQRRIGMAEIQSAGSGWSAERKTGGVESFPDMMILIGNECPPDPSRPRTRHPRALLKPVFESQGMPALVSPAI